MNNQKAQDFVQSIHDSIFKILTEAPDKKTPVLAKEKTVLILEKPSRTLNEEDYLNPWSPNNLEGSTQAAINLGVLADEAPLLPQNSGGVYGKGSYRLSEFYQQVLSANIDPQPVNPKSEKAYAAARAVLFTNGTHSQLSQNYDNNFMAYNIARSTYLLAYYDAMQTPEGKAKWPLMASAVQAPVDVAFNTWRVGEATKVEDARSKMQFHSRNQIARAFADAIKTFEFFEGEAEGLEPGNKTMRCRAIPSNWADPAAAKSWPTLTTSTKNLVIKSDSSFTQYGGRAAFNMGLFSIRGGGEQSSSSENVSVDASDVSVSFQYATVYLQRPWMNSSILSLPGWDLGAIPAGFFSNGNKNGNDGTVPLIPQGFIVTRNVKIQANWSKTDKETIKKATSASGGFSFGPFFSIGGSGGSSSSSSTSTFDEARGVLTMPGLHIIGWINTVTTACPPS